MEGDAPEGGIYPGWSKVTQKRVHTGENDEKHQGDADRYKRVS